MNFTLQSTKFHFIEKMLNDISFIGMSSTNNCEEQLPPESPLDVLSRVATMVEKSPTSPASAAAASSLESSSKSAVDASIANLSNKYTSPNPTENNEFNSMHSPPHSSEENQTISHNKSKFPILILILVLINKKIIL